MIRGMTVMMTPRVTSMKILKGFCSSWTYLSLVEDSEEEAEAEEAEVVGEAVEVEVEAPKKVGPGRQFIAFAVGQRLIPTETVLALGSITPLVVKSVRRSSR